MEAVPATMLLLMHAIYFATLICVSLGVFRCIKYCAEEGVRYDGTEIISSQETMLTCSISCRNMEQCEGFNYDSVSGTCHLLTDLHSLISAPAAFTAWSVKLCAGRWTALYCVFWCGMWLQLELFCCTNSLTVAPFHLNVLSSNQISYSSIM